MQIDNTNNIDITVIICTRNRALQLSKVLDSACELKIPADIIWEFVVVDNGSTDGTCDVVIRYAEQLPIRCVREEQAGLSNARNRGVDEAKGKYICWTDDDVVLDPDWLSAYAAAFKLHPEAAVFGGRIIPYLEKPTPVWFEKGKYDVPLNYLLAYRDFGDAIIALTFEGNLLPWGANYAVRTIEQRQHRYNPELGVSPQHKRVGEETDVIYHIFKDGGNGWWVPDSKVTHIIPPKRQTIKYLLEYFYLGGETMAYLRDKHQLDNHLLATGVQPLIYNYGKFRIYLRLVKRSIKLIIVTLLMRKSRLVILSEISYLIGAASYNKNSIVE